MNRLSRPFAGVARVLLLVGVPCIFLGGVIPRRAMAGDVEEFASLHEDSQREALLDAIRHMLQTTANIELATTTRVSFPEIDPKTLQVTNASAQRRPWYAFQLRRIAGSYWLKETRWAPGRPEPRFVTISSYDAEAGRLRSFSRDDSEPGKTFARIDAVHAEISVACRYAQYLGGMFVEERFEFFHPVLENSQAVRIEGIDRKNGLLEASLSYVQKEPLWASFNLRMWFDLNKNCALVRRREREEGEAGRTDRLFVVEDDIKVGDIWLPTRFTQTYWCPRGGPNGGPSSALEVTTAEDIHIGTVKPEDLPIAFPAGSYVTDKLAGSMYILDQSGEHVAWPGAEWGPEPPHEAAAQVSWWLVWMTVGCVVVFALGLRRYFRVWRS